MTKMVAIRQPNLKKQYPGFSEYELVVETETGYVLYGLGEYPASSVLFGIARRAMLYIWDSKEEAQRATGLAVHPAILAGYLAGCAMQVGSSSPSMLRTAQYASKLPTPEVKRER